MSPPCARGRSFAASPATAGERRRGFVRAMTGFLAVCATAFTGTSASAADSAWVTAEGGRFRLIAAGGAESPGTPLRAGLEIALDPGWKTYWRTPGDAGIPPELDFAGSHNLASAKVFFPAPIRFDEAGMAVAGYDRSVVLPIQIIPADGHKPTDLIAAITVGFCRDICVPASGTVALTLSPDMAEDGDAADLIARAEAAVPETASADSPLAILSVQPKAGAPDTAIVTARLADPAAAAELFVEGPPGTYADAPVRLPAQPTAPDRAAWQVSVSDDDDKPAAGPLTLTLVNGGRAIEARATPEGPPVP
ncbi:protein-disulfide reductase DsbD domain-containing protein [Pseudoxanthobacter soli]|nr:protein-disulfide reductase DsbD domain-containing protein [Pseudoxanthobacter soli]